MTLQPKQDTRDFKKNNSMRKRTLAALNSPQPTPSGRVPAIFCIYISPETHPWQLQGAGTQLRLALPRLCKPRDSLVGPESRLACLARERASKRRRLRWPSLRSWALLRPAPAPAQHPSGPSSHPQRSSGPGLTSPPTPSGSAFPRYAERLDPAYTFSRRPEVRSLCGGPWPGGSGRG